MIRREPSGQPHHLEIAAGLAFETTARLHAVQIAVNVEFEQHTRPIRGPADPCRIDPFKAEIAQIQCLNKHIDRANRIVFVDPILKAFWQKRRLPAIQPRYEARHPIQRLDKTSPKGQEFVGDHRSQKAVFFSVVIHCTTGAPFQVFRLTSTRTPDSGDLARGLSEG